MLLTVDIGNTNIVAGVYNASGEHRFSARLATDASKTADQYAVELRDILSLYDTPVKAVDGAIISSVVPPVSGSISGAIERLFGKKPLVVGPGIKTGLRIAIDNPAQLGSDMVAAAVAANADYELPVVVIDMGTATKVQAIGRDGAFLGCSITPGVEISLKALSGSASLLPSIALERPAHAIGTNTIDSMRSGVLFGYADLIDGMIGRFELELGTKVGSIVATGGLAREIVAECRHEIKYDPELVLRGLYLLYKKNA